MIFFRNEPTPQVAHKSSKGKGVVGKPKVAQETVTPPVGASKPPPAAPSVAHETVTPPKGAGPAAAGGAGAPPAEKKSSNLMIGAVLVGAVAASYYVTIHKMKDQVRQAARRGCI